MSLWGNPGPEIRWGYQNNMEVGTVCDITAEVVAHAGDAVVVTLLPGRQQAKIIGTLQVPEGCASISVFDATLVQKDPLPCFFVDDPTDILLFGRSNRESFLNVVELCSGLGVGTIGLQSAGMKSVAAADWSLPFVEAFRSMHPDVPCFHGDIASKDTLKSLYKAHPSPAVVMCGFACQPFSAGGSQRGADDQRSSTLYSALRAAFMPRSVGVILECVQDAATNSMVRRQIESFRDQCGFWLSEVVLQLESIWVSRRTRWWATLMVDYVGPVPLRASEPLPEPAVPRDVLPAPMAMSFEHLQQLELKGEELELFLTYQPRLAKMFLPSRGKAPTALHSWGSQVTKCECLCRSAGFSSATLQSRGLYGLLFPIVGEPDPRFPDVPRVRHPHPTEVAILTGVPEMIWPQYLRLCLAGLGQQASPLQSVWIASLLQCHVDTVFFGQSNLVPMGCLLDLRGRVSVLAEHLDFAPVAPIMLPEPPVESTMDLTLDDISLTPWAQYTHKGQADEVTIVHCLDGTPFVTKLSDPGTSIANVIHATCTLLDLAAEDCSVIDCSTGLTLGSTTPAAGLCLWITGAVPSMSKLLAIEDVSPTVPWVAEDPQHESATCDPPELFGSSLAVTPRDPVPEPLVSLDAHRLCLVPEPSVTDVGLLQALRKQSIDVQSRKLILANQGTLCADDELLWHAEQLLQAAKKPNWALLDPLLAAEALKRPSSKLLQQWISSLSVRPTAIIGVVQVDNHWIPFLWTWTAHCMIASCWDIPGPASASLAVLHQGLASALGSRTWTVHAVHRSFAVTEYCGCALSVFWITCFVERCCHPTWTR